MVGTVLTQNMIVSKGPNRKGWYSLVLGPCCCIWPPGPMAGPALPGPPPPIWTCPVYCPGASVKKLLPKQDYFQFQFFAWLPWHKTSLPPELCHVKSVIIHLSEHSDDVSSPEWQLNLYTYFRMILLAEKIMILMTKVIIKIIYQK